MLWMPPFLRGYQQEHKMKHPFISNKTPTRGGSSDGYGIKVDKATSIL